MATKAHTCVELCGFEQSQMDTLGLCTKLHMNTVVCGIMLQLLFCAAWACHHQCIGVLVPVGFHVFRHAQTQNTDFIAFVGHWLGGFCYVAHSKMSHWNADGHVQCCLKKIAAKIECCACIVFFLKKFSFVALWLNLWLPLSKMAWWVPAWCQTIWCLSP